MNTAGKNLSDASTPARRPQDGVQSADVDDLTRAQAAGTAGYALTRLRRADGSVSPHYLHPTLVPDEQAFERLMGEPRFAEIVHMEEASEAVADGPLDALAALAPTPRACRLFLTWLAFVNADLLPWTTGGSIHFRPHWARVLMLALTLGEAEGLPERDLAALCMAAVFHDSRRHDPYLDTGHGARAAAYYQAFCADEASRASRASVAGRTIAFDPRACLAIAWHDRDDEAGFAAIERSAREGRLVVPGLDDDRPSTPGMALSGGSGLHAEDLDRTLLIYRIFKDADGLDRVRLGANDLDVRYLRTDHAQELLPFAKRLLAVTNKADVR